jgi:hypothetical protein
MYNLSDDRFMETIVYLQNFGMDYFEAIRNNLNKFELKVVERLLIQLDPFDPIYRPILFKVKNQTLSKDIENVSIIINYSSQNNFTSSIINIKYFSL